jgi:hypothetical protein
MKRTVTALTLTALLLSTVALASDGYVVPWLAIPGGGGAISGGAFVLGNSIGQPAVGHATGGDFRLAGGFWAGVAPRTVYLPMMLHGG